MTRGFAHFWPAALCTAVAWAQPADTKPAFTIASVHVSPRATWAKTPATAMQGGYLIGDRYEIHRATMLDLIHLAYNIDADKIFGGPTWLDYDKFDVLAKAPADTRPEALRLMLQALLADRFQLSVKPDTQPLPAYILSGKDQTKLKAAEGGAAGGCQTGPGSRPQPSAPPTQEIKCQGVTMDEFVSGLRRLAPAYFDNLPAINSTGIEGSWDIDLKYPALLTRITPAGLQRENTNGIFEALDKQAGLKLELGKAPQAVMSVEAVKQEPTPDAAGVAAALPPLPPPQFDVAVLRPCDPAAAGNTPQALVAPRIEAGGRVVATCYPLIIVLTQALGLNNTGDLPGLPKTLQGSSTAYRISVTAKAPGGVLPSAIPDASQSRDLLNTLMRNLLADRFKLAYHYEDRPMDALTLVAAKPKLTKADPTGRTGCKQANPNNLAGAKLVCRNITMAQFAEQILGFYAAARYPVVDGTHLDGAWDFTLEYNPLGGLLQELDRARSAAGAAAGAAPGAAGGVGPAPAPLTDLDSSIPAGPASIAEAMEKQIGLKLETHKRPVPVLVIDHMEETPTDN